MVLFYNDNGKLQFRKGNYKYSHWQNFLRFTTAFIYITVIKIKLKWWLINLDGLCQGCSGSREFEVFLLVLVLFLVVFSKCGFLGP